MKSFKHIIFEKLSPLVGKKCVLPDLPYYSNVGDLMIWEGMERFLKDNGTEILWRSSISTFEYKPLPEDVTICLVGGGNFGDLWRGLQVFRNKIVKLYPSNRIIVFPQSVHYEEPHLCELDGEVFSRHNDIYLCARDNQSLVLFKEYFPTCHVLLVPDMALYLHFGVKAAEGNLSLFLLRTDKEAAVYPEIDTSGMGVTDWPTISIFERVRPSLKDRIRRILLKMGGLVGMKLLFFKAVESLLGFRLQLSGKQMSEKWNIVRTEFEYLLYLNKLKYPDRYRDILDWFVIKYYQPLAIQYCVEFLESYGTILSTRLHGGILGYLLNRKVYWMDDANKKISSFYATWSYLFDDRISCINQR